MIFIIYILDIIVFKLYNYTHFIYCIVLQYFYLFFVSRTIPQDINLRHAIILIIIIST